MSTQRRRPAPLPDEEWNFEKYRHKLASKEISCCIYEYARSSSWIRRAILEARERFKKHPTQLRFTRHCRIPEVPLSLVEDPYSFKPEGRITVVRQSANEEARLEFRAEMGFDPHGLTLELPADFPDKAYVLTDMAEVRISFGRGDEPIENQATPPMQEVPADWLEQRDTSARRFAINLASKVGNRAIIAAFKAELARIRKQENEKRLSRDCRRFAGRGQTSRMSGPKSRPSRTCWR